MKLHLFFTLISFCFIVFSCKKKEPNPRQESGVKQDTIPSFSHIDVNNVFKGIALDSTDLAFKKNFAAKFHKDYWEFNNVSGAFLVAYKGQIVFEKYQGYANKETTDTLTANTPLHLASVSKVITGMSVLRLVKAKYLELDKAVAHYLPAFPYKEITVRMLLNHRSGLPNYAYFTENPDYWDRTKTLKNKDILAILALHKPELYNPPNKGFSYCNTNYALLALIVEKVLKKPFKSVLQEMVFEPLGMKKSFVFELKDSSKVSQSYGFRGTKWEFNYLDGIYGDKNVYSTVRDLLLLDKALYSSKFLNQDLREQMFKGYSYESRGIKNYGLGIRLMEWPNKTLYYHNGWWHGNYTTFVHAKEDSATIIALGNKQSRAVYSAFNLVGLFGDYPLDLHDLKEDKDSTENKDSANINEQLKLQKTLDSVRSAAKKEMKKIKPIRKDSRSKKDSIPEKKDSVTLHKDSLNLKPKPITSRQQKSDSLASPVE